jgi:hypothetical protein
LQYAVELQLTVVPQKSKLTIWAIQAHTISWDTQPLIKANERQSWLTTIEIRLLSKLLN